MMESLKHAAHPHPSASRDPRRLRLLLLCTASQPLPAEVARLYGRGVAAGLEVGVVRLQESFFDLRAVLSHEGPMLVVLCHTDDVSLDLRLAAKRQFIMYSRPCHWLCSVKIGGGAQRSWLAVVSHMSRLSARVGTALLPDRG